MIFYKKLFLNETIGTEPVVCSRNVRILPDVDLESVKADTFDAVIGF